VRGDPRGAEAQLDPAMRKELWAPSGISKLHLAEGFVTPAGVAIYERQITFTYSRGLRSCYGSRGTEFTSREN